MIKEALQYIVGLGKTEIIDVKGQKYSTAKLNHIEELSPDSISISTLTGLVDYIKANVDEVEKTWLIQVVDHSNVRVLSPLRIDMSRGCFINTKAETPKITFNNFINTESFNIMLQSCFLESPDKTNILKVVGNIKEENVKTTGDDGISQTVTAKVGIAKVGEVVIPNPVTLVPFVTFVEIEQPEIKYVFRMQDGPRAALFESDGGAWRLRTMLKIKEYLRRELEGCKVEIIA